MCTSVLIGLRYIETSQVDDLEIQKCSFTMIDNLVNDSNPLEKESVKLDYKAFALKEAIT